MTKKNKKDKIKTRRIKEII